MAIVIRRVRTVQKKNHADALREKMKSIAEWLTVANRAAEQIKQHEKEIFDLMKADGLIHFDAPGVIANITQSMGKTVNIIDPKGLRAKLKNEEDFYACTTVSVTKAKEFLGAKELESITTSIAPVVGEPKLKISLLE